jgi:hypothetical protein
VVWLVSTLIQTLSLSSHDFSLQVFPLRTFVIAFRALSDNLGLFLYQMIFIYPICRDWFSK